MFMSILGALARVLPLLALLGACSAQIPDPAPDEVSRLAAGIMALNASIDPEEARRAADIAINYPIQLRREYGLTDPPIIHNMKVNSGLRPRGLCWHWAEDMQRRIEAENFRTLTTHRAIANSHTRILIDHSTVIVSAVDDDMFNGMVLDPWRYGGRLYSAPTLQDIKYTWVPREVVFDRRRAQLAGQPYAPSPSDDPSTEPLPEAL